MAALTALQSSVVVQFSQFVWPLSSQILFTPILPHSLSQCLFQCAEVQGITVVNKIPPTWNPLQTKVSECRGDLQCMDTRTQYGDALKSTSQNQSNHKFDDIETLSESGLCDIPSLKGQGQHASSNRSNLDELHQPSRIRRDRRGFGESILARHQTCTSEV
jgi:hypothetical protein